MVIELCEKSKLHFLRTVDVEQARDRRLAALLAVHLVNEVLEEASLIANATRGIG